MSPFTFITDQESQTYCLEIAQEMVDTFNISEEEAIGRINNGFLNQSIVGDDLAFYHEVPEYWAKSIYYEQGVHWWLGEEGLKPRAYP